MSKRNPPVKKFKVGCVNATIWKNEGDKGPVFSAKFERRYKDGDEWKSSNSFLLGQLDDVAGAIELAKTYIPLTRRVDQNDNSPEEE